MRLVSVDSVQELCSELRRKLQFHYGTNLRGVYLFGSWAREQADDESDVDVLVVLQSLQSYRDEVERTSSLIASLSLEYGASICLVFVRERDWLLGSSPFLLNVREEAIQA